MSITISITGNMSSELVTVSLSGTDGYVLEYAPNAGMHGESRLTETIRARIIGGVSAAADMVSKLNRMFLQAIDYVRLGIGGAIYLNVTIDGATWRSRIHAGKIETEGRLLYSDYANGVRDVAILIERDAWWESDTTSVLHFSNTSGSGGAIWGATGTIQNHTDAAHNNWLWVAGSAGANITGDMRTPMTLQITNTTGSSSGDTGTIYTGLNIFSSPSASYVYFVLEGEAGISAGGATVSIISGSGYSAGSAARCTWSGSAAEVNVIRWQAGASALNGNWLMPMVRLGTKPSEAFYLGFKVFDPTSGCAIYSGGQTRVAGDTEIIEGPILQIPFDTTSPGNFNLTLTLQGTTSGSRAVDVDYVQLWALDGKRTYKVIAGGNIAEGQYLADDMTSDARNSVGVYTGSNWRYIHTLYGAPLMLEPGPAERNTLWILQAKSADGTAPIDRTLTVGGSYRPRRRTL